MLRNRPVAAALLFALALCIAGPAKAQFPSLGGLTSQAQTAAAQRAVGQVLNTELPIRLDAKNLYPTVDVLPGGPFNPKPLTFTPATAAQPLAPGDYEVHVLAFCTEYSIHRP